MDLVAWVMYGALTFEVELMLQMRHCPLASSFPDRKYPDLSEELLWSWVTLECFLK